MPATVHGTSALMRIGPPMRPVAVARGNEKGRVERAIRYVRDAFIAARTFADLDDLNAQANAWCNGLAADRRCPEDLGHSVREVFAGEAPRLLVHAAPMGSVARERRQGARNAVPPQP
jgi:hypothetical protein